MSSPLCCMVLPSVILSSGVCCEQGSPGLSSPVACMQAAAEPPPAAQQPPPQNGSYQSSERSTGSHASDHQHSGSGSRLSSEPDSSPGSRERHVNGAAPDTGLLNLAAAAEQGSAAASPAAYPVDKTVGIQLHQSSVCLVAPCLSLTRTRGQAQACWRWLGRKVSMLLNPWCALGPSGGAEGAQKA